MQQAGILHKTYKLDKTRMRLLKISIIFISLWTLGGCAALTEDQTAKWTAKDFYDTAKESLDNGDYQTAISYFSKLEARYPYGRYAQQAQLETIYAHYKANESAAAIAAAERFIKLHPRHPNVDYAYYLRGLASFEPGRGILANVFPQDPAKSDPTHARQSFGYFKELVERFPKSRYAEDAIQRMTHLRNSLARYEILVAEYYFKRGAFQAAAKRGKYVLEHYSRTPSIPEALGIMVRAYRQMEMNDLANDSLRVLQQNYPDHPLLRQLR